MNILVIGSKGFIGSQIYKYFKSSQTGYVAYACDVVTEYNDPNYRIIDATQADFNEIFEEINFSVCINCAGAASVPDSLQHPLRDFTLNTFHVVKVLEAIRRHQPLCRFINLSSAAVYGNPERLPINEKDTCNPVSPYGLHKVMAEQICREYHQHFNLNTCSLRIFSAYGPGLKKQLFWDLFQKSRKGPVVQLFGTGLETRDFIFIEDIVKAIELILAKGDFDAGIYNLASGTETKISEAATSILAALNYEGSLQFSGNERGGDPINWRADITKLQALGFAVGNNLHEGLKKFVQWLDEERLR